MREGGQPANTCILSGNAPCHAKREFITVDGYDRFYTVHAPGRGKGVADHSLVLLLHGGGGTVDLMMRQFGDRLVELVNAGGGHHFPGRDGKSRFFDGAGMQKILGRKPKDFDSPSVVWQFLRSRH